MSRLPLTPARDENCDWCTHRSNDPDDCDCDYKCGEESCQHE